MVLARYGETEAQKEHFVPHIVRKRCIKKNFERIHDCFQKDLTHCDSQLRFFWTEEKRIGMDHRKCSPIAHHLEFDR